MLMSNVGDLLEIHDLHQWVRDCLCIDHLRIWLNVFLDIIIDKIKVRDRQRFGFDGFGNLRLKTFAQPDGELLPDRKFWNFSTGADHDDEPYGLGLAHWLYWPVFFKRAGIQYWMIFLLYRIVLV